MNKYYHRGNGEVVVPTRDEPAKALFFASDSSWEKHLASIPLYATLDFDAEIGWLDGVGEQKQVYEPRTGEWEDASETLYKRVPDRFRRILIVREMKPSGKCMKERCLTHPCDGSCYVSVREEGEAGKEESPNNIVEHLKNIKLLQAMYSGKKFYVDCMPTDTGAMCFPNSNRAVKEIDLPNFVLHGQHPAPQPSNSKGDEQEAVWDEAMLDLYNSMEFEHPTLPELKQKYRITKLKQ